MGKQILENIEKYVFIQVQARVLTKIYPDPYSLHLRSQGVWITIRGKSPYTLDDTSNFKWLLYDSTCMETIYGLWYTLKQQMKIVLKFLTFWKFKISFNIIQKDILSLFR